MPNDEGQARFASIGLCGSCRHHREHASRRGSVFHRCARADLDPDFPRYPPLPVRRCSGHESTGSAAPDAEAVNPDVRD